MAMRCALTSLPARLRSAAAPAAVRAFSDGKGRVLSEEERAKESVYIQKMERERLEKLKKKQEQEKADAEKAGKCHYMMFWSFGGTATVRQQLPSAKLLFVSGRCRADAAPRGGGSFVIENSV
ncbi:hypothetical protein BRADI_3g42869v3 [Brachypodium distachyon]|uniref:ATPase inhibitor n=1 Tax=Brachypodium distachyon TaxID=15368 RepID=A0A2K2D2S0_BRADI|nr:hypothetical protein BRADI_3g42869v3 [Brachypodium distachyon]